MADLKAFAEQLVNLTVKEVSELADILKDEYGIEPAAGGAVMVAGVVTGALALSKNNQLADRCPDKDNCPEGNRSLEDSASSLAIATNGLLAAGGVMVVAGVVLTIIGYKRNRDEHISVVPLFNSEEAGLSISGRF